MNTQQDQQAWESLLLKIEKIIDKNYTDHGYGCSFNKGQALFEIEAALQRSVGEVTEGEKNEGAYEMLYKKTNKELFEWIDKAVKFENRMLAAEALLEDANKKLMAIWEKEDELSDDFYCAEPEGKRCSSPCTFCKSTTPQGVPSQTEGEKGKNEKPISCTFPDCDCWRTISGCMCSKSLTPYNAYGDLMKPYVQSTPPSQPTDIDIGNEADELYPDWPQGTAFVCGRSAERKAFIAGRKHSSTPLTNHERIELDELRDAVDLADTETTSLRSKLHQAVERIASLEAAEQKNQIKVEDGENGRKLFVFNSLYLGYAYQEVDGFYAFVFDDQYNGCWSDYSLKWIANRLTELNREALGTSEWDYYNKHQPLPSPPLSEDSKTDVL